MCCTRSGLVVVALWGVVGVVPGVVVGVVLGEVVGVVLVLIRNKEFFIYTF